MSNRSTLPDVPLVQVPVDLVAEVQDSLLVVVHDLARLERLLGQAMENLLSRFSAASVALSVPQLADNPTLDTVRGELNAAVIELQFQDLASQLIDHTTRTLKACAYRLAADSMGSDDGEAAPFVPLADQRPNPVTQGEMDAGSIELF
ncbi:MAG: hypothetical protein FGM55_00245 [Rhodoferax sp.]|nr:hypothetical protein [Rhodoferax sp.]